jgi:hypothetical protein
MLGIDFALTPLCNVLKSPLRDFQVGPKIITHKPPFASFLPVTKGALEAVGITYPRWGEFKPPTVSIAPTTLCRICEDWFSIN